MSGEEKTMTRLPIVLMTILLGCPVADEPALVGVSVSAVSARGAAFETEQGYEISLVEGSVVVGDLHFHEPKAVEEYALRSPTRRPPGPTLAHPGHDMSGDVRGELAGTFVVDLLAAAAALGEASFYEGPYETASLLLVEPGGSGATALLAGTADDGDGEIPFDLVVDHTETVLGIPFEAEIEASAPPALTLVVDPASILGHLDFAALDGDGDGTVTASDEGVSNPLLFGLESNLTFDYSVE